MIATLGSSLLKRSRAVVGSEARSGVSPACSTRNASKFSKSRSSSTSRTLERRPTSSLSRTVSPPTALFGAYPYVRRAYRARPDGGLDIYEVRSPGESSCARCEHRLGAGVEAGPEPSDLLGDAVGERARSGEIEDLPREGCRADHPNRGTQSRIA